MRVLEIVFFYKFSTTPKLCHEYHQRSVKRKEKKKQKKNEASLSKDIKNIFFHSFRDSGSITREKCCIPVSFAVIPRKGRISRIHSFERTNMSENTGENERSRLDDARSNMDYEESPTTSSRSRHSLAPPCSLETDLFRISHPGTAFTFDFYMLPFLPPHESANLRILLLSLHEPPLVYK